MNAPKRPFQNSPLALCILCATASASCTRNSDSPAVAPIDVSAPPLPSWFGDDDGRNRRIAGTLFGDRAPLAGRVYLRIDVADPTIWSGMERVTGPDGRFDFGDLRRGRYSLLATAPGRTSRLIGLDTTTDPTPDMTELHAYSCVPSVRRILSKSGRPLGGAKIDIGGVVLATTDAHGRYTLCISEELLASREPIVATVRASEHAAKVIQVQKDAEDVALSDAAVVGGTIIDHTGAPLRDVVVQLAHASRPTTHSNYFPVPLQGVTNTAGEFEIRNAPSGERPYYVRLIIAQKTFIHHSNTYTTTSLANLKLSVSSFVEEHMSLPNARISGRVLYHGTPLADALVAVPGFSGEEEPKITRSRMDGSFDLAVATTGSVGLLVHRRDGHEVMREIAVAPGQHIRDVTIELGDDRETHQRRKRVTNN